MPPFLQLATARPFSRQKDGIAVVDESAEPHRLYAEGAYRLSDELRLGCSMAEVVAEAGGAGAVRLVEPWVG